MKYLITIIPLLFSSLLLAQDVNMQTATVNQCGGVFYDSGGEFGNYGNDENFILTICPENAGQKIQIDFTSFVTQLGAVPDVMSLFNGDSVASPPYGDFSGTNSPGLYKPLKIILQDALQFNLFQMTQVILMVGLQTYLV